MSGDIYVVSYAHVSTYRWVCHDAMPCHAMPRRAVRHAMPWNAVPSLLYVRAEYPMDMRYNYLPCCMSTTRHFLTEACSNENVRMQERGAKK